jgi:molecular chaperone GrpE
MENRDQAPDRGINREGASDAAAPQGAQKGAAPEEMRATETAGPAPLEGAAAAEEAAEETLDSVREQLKAARDQAEEQLRGWQRAQADFTNYRRRMEKEREEFVQFAEASIIRDLLPILDDLDRALQSLPPELRGVTWVEGISLIERKIRTLLESHGLTPIEALGKEFDPHEHEAVMRDGDPGEPMVVTGELQRGYRLHDRVLRPTLVRVGQPAGST